MSMLGRFEAPIIIPTGGYAYTLDETGIGTAALTLTAGVHYYWSNEGFEGTADAGGLSLVERIESDLNANSPNSQAYTVTLNATADNDVGTITIATTGVDFKFTSVTAGFLSLLNFSSGSIGSYASSHTSNSGSLQALWMPDCPPNALYGLNSYGKPESQTVPMIAPDGTFSAFHGSTMTRNRIWFEMVTRARTIQAEESSANESFEQFWTDAIRGEAAWAVASRSLMFIPDRSTGVGATSYRYHVTNPGMPDYERVSDSDDLYYRVSLDLVKAV